MPEKELKRILIVDDDRFSQDALRLFLQRNFNIESCDNGSYFFKILSEKKIDLILMDISIRGNKNGLDLTREIRSNNLYKNIPVICLTAHIKKVDKMNAMEAGVDIYVSKPVSNSKLLEIIGGLIGK